MILKRGTSFIEIWAYSRRREFRLLWRTSTVRNVKKNDVRDSIVSKIPTDRVVSFAFQCIIEERVENIFVNIHNRNWMKIVDRKFSDSHNITVTRYSYLRCLLKTFVSISAVRHRKLNKNMPLNSHWIHVHRDTYVLSHDLNSYLELCAGDCSAIIPIKLIKLTIFQ